MIRMADNNDFREKAAQLRRQSMNMGTVLGVYYIVKFCLFPMSMTSGALGMLFIVLTLMVPFVVWRMMRRYLQAAVPEGMPFVVAWTFALRIFFFASLLVAVAHYVYFAFIDGGALAQAYMDSLATLRGTPVEGIGDPLAWQNQLDMLEKTFQSIAALTPIQLVMQLFVNNLFWGSIAALFIALLVMRRPVLKP